MSKSSFEKRASIPSDETRRLWVVAGGRCEYCSKYLLEDEFSTLPVNLAERAHIVGATNASGSPRGQDQMSLQERAKAENLMLMCGDHHKVIDQLVEQHAVGGLKDMKAEHEARVRLLTGMGADRQTVILRVFGDIRGGPTSLPRNVVQRSVIDSGRFPDFRLAARGDDIEIDLRHQAEEGDDLYWQSGVARIAAEAERIHRAQDAIDHLSVFALARIPLLIALGFHLDDKLQMDIYQRDRSGTGDLGWHRGLNGPSTEFAVEKISDAGGASDEVAIAFSVSGPIGEDVKRQLGTDSTIYEMKPRFTSFGRNSLLSRGSINNFADTYHETLVRIESEHPSCERLLIFPAVPVAGAVQIGRGIMKQVHPALVVFDRNDEGHFNRALVLGNRADPKAVLD